MRFGFAVLPLLTALIAALLAARVGGSAVRRFAPAKLLWAFGLLLFAIAAAAEAYGESDGWGSASFRAYYLAGGCLTVGFLGVGSALLSLPRDPGLVLVGALTTATVGAVVGVLVADLDPAILAAAHGHRPPANDALTGHAFVWAIAINTVGSLLLLGSSVASIVRRRRVAANVALVVGIAIVALSGTLTRFGSYGFVYVGQIVGLVLLAAGFERAVRMAVARPRVRGLAVSAARSDPTAS